MTEPKTDRPSREVLDRELAQMLDDDTSMAQAFARAASIDHHRHDKATRNLSVHVADALHRQPVPGQRWTRPLAIAVPSLAAVAALVYMNIGTTPTTPSSSDLMAASGTTAQRVAAASTMHTAETPAVPVVSSYRPSVPASPRVTTDAILADLAVDHVVDQLIDTRTEDEPVVRITETDLDNLFVGL